MLKKLTNLESNKVSKRILYFNFYTVELANIVYQSEINFGTLSIGTTFTYSVRLYLLLRDFLNPSRGLYIHQYIV